MMASVLAVQAQDVIRVQTRLVEIDVVARNESGAVAGLSKDDFTLLDDGKPRKIDVFAVTEASPGQQKSFPAPTAANVAANRAAPGVDDEQTTTVILVDRLNTAVTDQAYAKQQLSGFLHSQWHGERIAIYTLDSALHVIQEFTNDAKQLNAAVSALGPEQSPSGGIDDKVRKTLAAWTTIARHVAIIPGHKNLVWLSSGFPRCSRDGRVSVCFDDDIANAARVLNDARVAVYPIDVRGFRAPAYVARPRGYATPDFSPTLADVSIDTFAESAHLTGGVEFHDTNSVEGAIRKVMDDSDIVYTLGLYLSDNDLDGAFHRIKVEVSKKGVDLRYRAGYMATKDIGLTPEQRRTVLSEAVHGPLQSSAIGLRATATADPGKSGNYQLVVSIDAHDMHFEQMDKVWTSAFEVALTWDPSPPDKVTTEPVPIVLTDDQFHDALKRSLLWRKTVSVGTKARSLRVVIQDQATGAIGSVTIPLKMN